MSWRGFYFITSITLKLIFVFDDYNAYKQLLFNLQILTVFQFMQ
ncbi:hypothetical protein LX69_03167 [Breznakibacter xylanolyticus]|uniref:Uncharacterized protein n=1 Tax=Breznakibacter xylanolyticus TaxID=990 RepID=A0A2W7N389_9BACT|nr:hypothetical protein LX69_03167 [Breznakibacter xylanolyticus]